MKFKGRPVVTSIRQKIIIPFILLFMGVAIISFFLYQHLVTGVITNSLNLKLLKTADVISSSGISLNSFFLNELKKVTGVEIVVTNDKGEILLTTLENKLPGKRARFLFKPQEIEKASRNERRGIFGTITLNHKNYALLYRRITHPAMSRCSIVLLSSFDEANKLIAKIRTGTFMISVGTFALLLVIGNVISRNFTDPISKLVVATRDIVKNRASTTLPVSRNDEIGELARAFSAMLEQLRDYEAQLIETEKLATAGKIAAEVAHEIKNPLSSIKMMTQLLATRVDATVRSKALSENLISEINRLETIVETVLSSARPEEINPRPASIPRIVTSTVELLRPQLTHLKIKLSIEIDENIPDILVDELKMKQVLLNILKNSSEAMPKGGNIYIRIKRGNDNIRIIIDDEGIGIPGDIKQKIFEPFFTTKREGTGLGLHTCQKIVQLHGGSIKVSDIPLGGSRFVISLPWRKWDE